MPIFHYKNYSLKKGENVGIKLSTKMPKKAGRI